MGPIRLAGFQLVLFYLHVMTWLERDRFSFNTRLPETASQNLCKHSTAQLHVLKCQSILWYQKGSLEAIEKHHQTHIMADSRESWRRDEEEEEEELDDTVSSLQPYNDQA